MATFSGIPPPSDHWLATSSTSDFALQTGLYAAAVISGVAAAYVLKEYISHFWDSWGRDLGVRNDSDSNKVDRDDDLKAKHEPKLGSTSWRPARNEERSPIAGSPPSLEPFSDSRPSTDVSDTPISPGPPESTIPAPCGEDEPSAHAASSQTRTLPPLRTHSLPPPPPNAQLILSGAHPDVPSLTHLTSPTTMSSSLNLSRTWTMVGSEGENATEVDGDDLGVTSPVSESLVEILSPHPTQGISRRHSLRAHDLFAASHISFSELGSLAFTDNQPN